MGHAAGENSEGSEKDIIASWRKGYPCYIMELSLGELCPIVVWKAELLNDELGYLAKEISKQGSP